MNIVYSKVVSINLEIYFQKLHVYRFYKWVLLMSAIAVSGCSNLYQSSKPSSMTASPRFYELGPWKLGL